MTSMPLTIGASSSLRSIVSSWSTMTILSTPAAVSASTDAWMYAATSWRSDVERSASSFGRVPFGDVLIKRS